MTYSNYKGALMTLVSNTGKLLQNAINTRRNWKMYPRGYSKSWTENSIEDDSKRFYDDDEYWYQLWADSPLEEEYEPHTQNLNY